MSKLSNQQQLESNYLMETFERSDVLFVRGEGMHLYDSDDKEYLDFLAGIGVVSAGHSNPQISEAIAKQAKTLMATSNYFYSEHRGEVAKLLSDLVGEKNWRTFFTNAGTETNETAIKLARAWGAEHKNGAYRIITVTGSFHGRTYASMTATGQPQVHNGFGPLPEGFDYVEPNNLEELKAAITDETIGIMLEPIRGESGVWPCDQDYLMKVRELCDEQNILLMLDEIQTGIFRCGKPYCFQTYGVLPDIFMLAKGIANGMPVGACVARDDVAASFKPGMHGTTFGGSPIGMAAAHATLHYHIDNESDKHAEKVGAYLRAELEKLPFITEVRGRGLMVGVSLEKDLAVEVRDALLDNGVVINAPKPNVLRFLPPLIVTPEDVDTLIQSLVDTYQTLGE